MPLDWASKAMRTALQKIRIEKAASNRWLATKDVKENLSMVLLRSRLGLKPHSFVEGLGILPTPLKNVLTDEIIPSLVDLVRSSVTSGSSSSFSCVRSLGGSFEGGKVRLALGSGLGEPWRAA
mmetsp:Transcript_14542/g.45719  ORF Transcript_14542/g.45719 Transcript_14542/m.45719 type:complete len:123 (+) Transcript_14542:117-485(+)